ncbi:MAG: MFS transporter [Chloroflexota bacterium]
MFYLLPLMRVERVGKRGKQVEQEETSSPDHAFPLTLMLLVMGFIFLSQGSSAACQSFCSAFMDTDLKLSPSTIGLITGAGQFVAIFAPLLAPRLVARYGHSKMLMFLPWAAAFSLIPLVFLPGWFSAGWGRLGTLTASAIWFPTIQVFQMELVNARWRSMAYAFVSMAGGLSFSVVSFAGGYLADTYGYYSLFILGICMSACGGMVMYLLRQNGVVTRPVTVDDT